MKITRGDLEIAINVTEELLKPVKEQFDLELQHLSEQEYDCDCPSYYEFNDLIDHLTYLENYKKNLTN